MMQQGQGRPVAGASLRRIAEAIRGVRLYMQLSAIVLALVLLWSSMPLNSTSAEVISDSLAFEVRVVWGGGPVRAFAGKFSLSQGSLEIVRCLGLQDDAAGSLRSLSQSEMQVMPHSPASFGGVDLRLKGPADAELVIQWQDSEGGRPPEPIRVRLSQLLNERLMQQMDSRGSRLAIERRVHDRIRAKVDQASCIYSSGQRCSLTVEGYHNEWASGEYRLNVRLMDSAHDKLIEHLQRDVDIDARGCFSPQVFSDIVLPSAPGVYSFEIGIQRKRLINSFINSIAVTERRLDVVVADGQVPVGHEVAWRTLAQVYPAGASWWDQVGRFRIPSVKSLTPLVAQVSRPLSSGDHSRRIVNQHECMVLDKGAWQAFPLAVSEIGRPHRVRIRVPNDKPQRLAFSLQESSSEGDVSGLRLDSGLTVEPGPLPRPELVEHELVFWPRTAQPMLLVLNADAAREAALAEIELEVSESDLSDQRSPATKEQPGRLAALYFDKPLLAENFGALRRLDTKGQREMDSWQTSFEATRRLADYTAWSGHNAAILTIATQGGAIYPSQRLALSPKFDSGTFLSDGSSVAIKDTVELACRQFDRLGLKLILALELDGPLPELQRLPDNGERSSGLFQIDQSQQVVASGQAGAGRAAIRYNPLDARVQNALAQVVREVVERYGQHACFAGVQLNLTERTHFNFSGDRWGYDPAAIARFERSLGNRLPEDAEQRQRLLSGTLRADFLLDRARALAPFYGKLATEIADRKPGAVLLVSPAKLLAATPHAEDFQDVESRALSAQEILLGCGLDCESLVKQPHVSLLRPLADSPLRSPVARAWAFQLAGDTQLDHAFAGSTPAALLQQLPSGYRLPDFDKVSPLGTERSRTWLFPHVSKAGDAARQSFVSRLHQADAHILADGGWLAVMGQEAQVRPLLQVFTQLPPMAMDEVVSDGLGTAVHVRRGIHAGHTYFQFINNASWPVKLRMHLKSRQAAQLVALEDATVRLSLVAGESTVYEVDMPAYGLSGMKVDTSEVEVTQWEQQVEPGVAEQIEQRISELQDRIDRASELNVQQTLGLQGGDFETWDAEGKPLGWSVASHPNASIKQERELPRSGAACVAIENRGTGAATAWIQSDRIAIPSTGRLALEVWVRSTPGNDQPTVRLSLIGRHRDGRRFQRWHEFVANAASGSQLPIDWGRRPLVLLVPDVPNDDLVELQVAVDVVGPGKLWVDDVRVYGMYLDPDEKVHLLGQMFLAKEQMRRGDLFLADQMLQGFWACFLSTYLSKSDAEPAPAAAEVSANNGPVRKPSGPTPAWRTGSNSRLNQWQEAWRQRWQR